ALLERLLAQTEPDDATLAAVQRLLEDDEAAPLLLICARGERAGGFVTIEEIKLTAPRRATWQHYRSAVENVWLRRLTVDEALAMLPENLPSGQAALLRHETKLVEIAKRPPHEWPPLLQTWQAEAKALPGLARMLAPAAGSIGRSCLRSHAELRCAA